MVDFTFLKYLLRRFGPAKVMAHDKSRLRPAVEIEANSAKEIIDKLVQLKDGPDTWEFSIEIKPSR